VSDLRVTMYYIFLYQISVELATSQLLRNERRQQGFVRATESPYKQTPLEANTSLDSVRNMRKLAYVTLMCDDESLLQTATLVASLLQTGTTADVVVMASSEVSVETPQLLKYVAPHIRVLNFSIEHEFNVKRRIRPSQYCRYSKLNVWSLVSYKRILYIDSDAIVLRSLDALFFLPVRRPDCIYAVADVYPRIFNSGLMLIRPSRPLFKSLIQLAPSLSSYNRGDQGFLNAYFNKLWRNTSEVELLSYAAVSRQNEVGLGWIPLDAQYNFPTWLANSYYGKSKYPHFPSGVSVVHFAGELKPWRLRSTKHMWHRLYEPRAYLGWWNQADRVINSICEPGHNHSLCAQFHAGALSLPCRSCKACGQHVRRFAFRTFEHAVDSFTVMISTYHGDRLPLDTLIQHYANSSKVSRVVVVWHDPHRAPPLPLTARTVNGAVITILHQHFDTLNNRFIPFDVDTARVLVCDDDVLISLDDLHFAFAVARENDERLVSPFVRAHRPRADPQLNATLTNTAGYFLHDSSFALIGSRSYSIALTKFCFIPSWLLFVYSCLLNPRVYAYINEKRNCEDVAFNILGGVIGLKAPVMVDITVHDFGSKDGLSTRRNHLRDRSKCVDDLLSIFSTRALKWSILRHSSSSVRRYISTRVKYEELTPAVRRSKTLNSPPRLMLQPDQAAFVYPVEDCSIDLQAATGVNAPGISADNYLVVRGAHGRSTSGASGIRQQTRIDARSGTEVSTLSSDRTRTFQQHQNSQLLTEAVLLLKFRWVDLDRLDTKDERHGVVLVNLVLTPLDERQKMCFLSVYFAPKLPESWTSSTMSTMTRWR